MEDRCIACGDVVPEGRQVCQKCESMTEKEAIYAIEHSVIVFSRNYGKSLFGGALQKAIKALRSQIKLKQYIKRINQPEYKDIKWSKDEVILMLQELVAE